MKIDIYNTDKKYNNELDIGKAGEQLACAILIKQGYMCIEFKSIEDTDNKRIGKILEEYEILNLEGCDVG